MMLAQIALLDSRVALATVMFTFQKHHEKYKAVFNTNFTEYSKLRLVRWQERCSIEANWCTSHGEGQFANVIGIELCKVGALA